MPKRPARKREKNLDAQPQLPSPPEAATPSVTRVLSIQLQVGDRLIDETGKYEVIARPYATAAGKSAHVRVRRVDNVEVTMIRTYGAHERVGVRRASAFNPDALRDLSRRS